MSIAVQQRANLVPWSPMTGHPPKAQWPTPPPMTIDLGKVWTATLATSQGNIGVELLPKMAPNAVNNFVFLASQGFYERTPIHRVVKDFMVQSGDPTGKGTGGPGYMFNDELPPNDTIYTKGTVAMANSGPNTQGSQFFVMTKDTTLPASYTIFGRVTDGLDVLERLNRTATEDNGQGEVSKPVSPIGIYNVTVQSADAPPPPPPPKPAPPK